MHVSGVGTATYSVPMSTATAEAGNVRAGTAQGRWVLAATVAASGLVMLDATVVNVALARIGDELDVGFAGLQWISNAYTLTLASFILIGGVLGDRYGRRRVFLIGTVWFALASALCAVSVNEQMLIAARALQGVGGALVAPGSLAIISSTFVRTDRARAIGVWSGLGGIATAAGPFVGGWLVAVELAAGVLDQPAVGRGRAADQSPARARVEAERCRCPWDRPAGLDDLGRLSRQSHVRSHHSG